MTDLPDRELAGLLLALVPAVVLGEAYFWGSLNGLRNGLFDLLGPYYHFDLLLPFAAFGAHGAVELARRGRRAVDRLDRRHARVALAAALLLAGPAVAAAEYRAVAGPYDANRERTADLAVAYEPFRTTDLDHAVVFHPTPYGDWIAHPFQKLRNGPGFDGDAVYVLDEGPADDVRALEATGDRRPYRYTYRGTWDPGPGDPVEPALVPLSVREGDRLAATTTVGIIPTTTRASVRIETERGYARYALPLDGDRARVNWSVDDRARVTNLDLTGGSPPALPPGASEVDLVVTLATESGSTISYRQETTVEAVGGRLRVVWPPETRVCRLTTECGTEGTYVGPDGDYLSGVAVTSNATVA